MGLTMLRLLLLPFFLLALVSGPDHLAGAARWWAIGIFVVMALTDKLDGYLARKLNQTSKLGAILDPVADKLLITCTVFLLAVDRIAPAGYAIPWWVVTCVYSKDVVTVLGILILFSLIGPLHIRARWLGKASTFLQLLLVLLTLVSADLAGLHRAATDTTLRALWWIVAAVSLATTVDYVIEGVRRLRAANSPRH